MVSKYQLLGLKARSEYGIQEIQRTGIQELQTTTETLQKYKPPEMLIADVLKQRVSKADPKWDIWSANASS